MIGPGEAVGAAVFAAAVGIQPGAERDVGRIVEGDDRLRVIAEKLRARQDALAVFVHERLGFEFKGELFEAIVRIRDGTSTAGRGGLGLKHMFDRTFIQIPRKP